ncbi:MAG: type II toxin-antitoxin system VapC family toxin [Acidobacteria bacterium]|nr:type II toxin-antitoxin system VapC family toxin [Acidobacteriota bacterium]
MRRYFDTAYLAKYYLHEPESTAVEELVLQSGQRGISILGRAEFACILHRHVRENRLSLSEAEERQEMFQLHVARGAWQVHDITASLMARVEARLMGMPADLFLRSGDAIHLATAELHGYREIWSNDRHLLAAAPLFGLTPRSLKHP